MRWFFVTLCLLVLGCSGDPDGVTYSSPDSGTDAVADTGHDGGEDTTLDLGDDGGEDVGNDTPDVADDDTDVARDLEPDVVEDPCETFSVSGGERVVPPLRSVEVVPTGGSGVYAWAFAPDGNRSGAILDEGSGLYLSGRNGGVTDVVRVTDVECDRQEDVEIRVVASMLLLPVDAVAAPGEQFCFVLTGGSTAQDDPDADFEWYRSQRGTGLDGDIDSVGCYVAGSVEGVDIIVVEDLRTGESREARVRVTRQPIELTTGVPSVMIPATESFPVRVSGGSGVYDFTLRGEADATIELDEDEPWAAVRVQAWLLAGATQLIATDRFAPDRQTRLDIQVMELVEHDYAPYGTHSDGTTAESIGDINGDGFPDLAVGTRAASLNGQHSGALYIYLGGDGSLSETPAQILYGPQRYDYFGRAVASGDFDGDGCADLAVPGWGRSAPNGQTGAVEIWSGCNAVPPVDPYRGNYQGRASDNLPGISDSRPLRQSLVMTGPTSGDRFGFAVAAGDFNGDGWDDLAVASPYDESPELVDPETNDVLSNNGRVRVYLGGDEGLNTEPWLIIDGLVLEEDGTTHGEQNLEFGHRMAAADVNDDGCADLLVGAPRHNNYRGAASLHLSAPSNEFPSGCALNEAPAVFVVQADEDQRRGGRLGWHVDLVDLDGDCVEDIVASQMTAATPGRGSTSAGTVFVLPGDLAWTANAPQRIRRDAARFIARGDDWDNLGTDFSTGDLNADGYTDLVVGARWGEGGDSASNVGEVRFYPGTGAENCVGVPDEVPLFGEPVSLYNTARYGDLFGQTVEVVPDATGDDVPDLIVYATRGPGKDVEDQEDHLGRVYLYPGGETDWVYEDGTTLQTPAVAAEEFYGYAVERIGDFNEDGFDDVLTAAPYFDRVEVRPNDTLVHASAGVVYLHMGGPDGIRGAPDLVFRDYDHHSGSDLLGYSMSTAGDFDGDGVEDVALGALGEDSFGGPCVACRDGGPGRSGIGAVYVYRGGSRWGARHGGDADSTPVANEPDFVICGPAASNRQLGREVHGGFDHNADGYDDLLLSNWNWSGNRGRVWYVEGRPASEGTQVVCTSDDDETFRGVANSDYVGWRMDATDINADGCDDLLAGATNFDPPGFGNAGAVWVQLGAGPGCLPEPVTVQLIGARANENMGHGLATADTNGDGVTDVLVGSTGIGPSNEGAVTVLDGQALIEALRGVEGGATIPMDASLRQGFLRDPTRRAGSDFGRSIAVLGDVDGDGTDDVAVGARLSRVAASEADELTGGAFVYLGSRNAPDLDDPEVWVGGQTDLPLGYFGERLAGGRLGPGGAAVLVVGSPYTESRGPVAGELGAVFIGTLPPLR